MRQPDTFSKRPSATGLMAVASIVVGSCTFVSHASAFETMVSVNARDDIYMAAGDDGSDGFPPVFIDVSGLSSLTFTLPPGQTITLNGGGNFNDPDGVGAAVSSSSETGTSTIAGLSAPYAGYLTGLFIGSTISTKPAALSFGTTDFTSLSPELQQAFFIGDGLTGDGTGSVQTFYVPTGATQLVLGISDACGYNGGPSCYGDNFGTFAVTVDGMSGMSTVPLPASAPMFGAGLLALGAAGLYRKRRTRSSAA